MSTYRRHRMLRSLYLDALYAEDYPFPPSKRRPKGEKTAGDRAPKHPLLEWLRDHPPV